jgi:hypothetical protein
LFSSRRITQGVGPGPFRRHPERQPAAGLVEQRLPEILLGEPSRGQVAGRGQERGHDLAVGVFARIEPLGQHPVQADSFVAHGREERFRSGRSGVELIAAHEAPQ